MPGGKFRVKNVPPGGKFRVKNVPPVGDSNLHWCQNGFYN